MYDIIKENKFSLLITRSSLCYENKKEVLMYQRLQSGYQEINNF